MVHPVFVQVQPILLTLQTELTNYPHKGTTVLQSKQPTQQTTVLWA